MDVTVRTLQYYDKEGLLNPSSKSEGGRRLYTKKDIVKLPQILSLKYLGFSLDEIKGKLFSLDNPVEVCKILEQQSEIIKNQIEKLTSALSATKALQS
ncbi:MAG: MerR family transcriptional regulator [Romboutsia sp.]